MKENEGPTLLILAAGIGSRYGGSKQTEAIGPNNETILEYSIFDAIRTGFKRIVFVINTKLEETFNSRIIPKYRNRIELDYVFQKLDHLPEGYHLPIQRKKPWGTGHAVLSAKGNIHTPFAVINADDFYGSSAFEIMGGVLGTMDSSSSDFFLVGYRLGNTLSDHGSVSRGLCAVKDGFLASIKELRKITKNDIEIVFQEDGKTQTVDPDSIVSMNFWGFSPNIFNILERQFKSFLQKKIDSESAEFFIVDPLDHAIKNRLARIGVLTTTEKWLGITYLADREMVINGIKRRIEKGFYPEKLHSPVKGR